MMKKMLSAGVAAAMTAGALFAAEPGMTRSEGLDRAKPLNFKVHFVEKTQTPPKIDGVLDDACWQSAAVLDDYAPSTFAKPFPIRPVRTEVRCLWDARYLYLAIKCYEDTEANMEAFRHSIAESQKSVHARDCIELQIDGKNDEWTQHTVWLSASGEKLGEWVYDFGWGKITDHNWQVTADWTEATSEGKDATGPYWAAETRIALADIEVEPRAGYVFGMEPARFRWHHQLYHLDGTPVDRGDGSMHDLSVLGWGTQGTWHKRLSRFGKCILVERRPKDIVEGLRVAYPDLDRREVRIRGGDGYLKIENGTVSHESYLDKCRSLAEESKAALATLDPLLAIGDKAVAWQVKSVEKFRAETLAKIAALETSYAERKSADVGCLDKAEKEAEATKKAVESCYYRTLLAMMTAEQKVRFPVKLDPGADAPDLKAITPFTPKTEDWKDPTLIAWGRPMASGAKKVLALVCTRDAFAVQHLRNRLEIEADVVQVRNREALQKASGAQKLADIEHALARGGYDGYLFIGVHQDWLPDRLRCRIVEDVLAGTPIVMISAGRLGTGFKESADFALGAPAWFDKLTYANEALRERTAESVRSGPGKYDLVETTAQLRPISRGVLGKGRVTCYGADEVENSTAMFSSPILTPSYTVPPSKAFQDEYCYAYAARVVAEGLGMRGEATVRRVTTDAAQIAGEPVKATVEVLAPEDWKGLAVVTVRNALGAVLETKTVPVGCGANAVELAPTDVGTHWVDAVLQTGGKKALDFAAARLEVTAGAATAAFAEVRSMKTGFERDEFVEVLACVRRCVPGLVVNAEIADVRGRVLDRGRFPVSGRSSALVRFSPARLRLNAHVVNQELVDAAGRVLDRTEQWIFRKVGDLEDFRVFDGTSGHGGKDVGARLRLFAWHGMDILQGGNPMLLWYGNDPATRDRLPGSRNVWNGALNCPRWKRWMHETFARHARELSARNGRFISLGDDSGVPTAFEEGRPDWVSLYFQLLAPRMKARQEALVEAAKTDPRLRGKTSFGHALQAWADEHELKGFDFSRCYHFYWGFQDKLQGGAGLRKLLASKLSDEDVEMFRRAIRESYDDVRVFNHANRVQAKDLDSIDRGIIRALDPDLRVEYAYFLRWLEQRYGGDIARLNAAWGVHEKDFWTIEESVIEEARKNGRFAAVIDKQTFLEDSFLDNCRIIGEAVHDVDPTIAVGYGASTLGSCLIDYFKYLDTSIPYGKSGVGGDFDLIASRPHAYAGETIGWYGTSYGSDEESVPESIRIAESWHTLLAGGNFCWMWTALWGVDGARAIAPGSFGYSWRAHREIQRGPAALLIRSKLERDGIAIFVSRPCERLAAVKMLPTTHAAARRAWAKMFSELGLRYGFVTSDDIAAGALRDVRLLVLPMCDVIDGATAAKIAAFAQAGGKVVADFAPGGYAECGDKLASGTLDGLVGHGLEVWNENLTKFGTEIGKSGYQATRTAYEKRLAALGVKPAVRVTDAAGRLVQGLSITRFSRADGWQLAFEKERLPGETYPMTVTVELPEAATVYDVRANNAERNWKSTSPTRPTPIARGRSFKTTFRGSDICLFSCQKAPIEGVDLEFKAEPTRGGTLALRAKVKGATASDVRVLRVEFVPPEGFPWTEFQPIKRYVEDAPGGVMELNVPLAWNERGDLTVEVTDVASGATARKALVLKDGTGK